MNTYLKNLIDSLGQNAANIDLGGFVLCIFISLLASVLVTLMYLFLYEHKNSGSGVYKSFLIIGPSVTAMFLAIQFSLPLSLGLLGALSFVRFRTPIKDPEEVSYILLLIASSIASATYNFSLVAIILLTVFAAQIAFKKCRTKRFFSQQRSHVIFSVSGDAPNEQAISDVLSKNLKQVSLRNISKEGNTINFHYSFSNRTIAGYDELLIKLNKIAKIDSFNIVTDDGSI